MTAYTDPRFLGPTAAATTVGIFDDPARARNKSNSIFRSFPVHFAFGTAVAIVSVSTWFHKPI
jgi:hypothetical protein